jgi:hypothetical protein
VVRGAIPATSHHLQLPMAARLGFTAGWGLHQRACSFAASFFYQHPAPAQLPYIVTVPMRLVWSAASACFWVAPRFDLHPLMFLLTDSLLLLLLALSPPLQGLSLNLRKNGFLLQPSRASQGKQARLVASPFSIITSRYGHCETQGLRQRSASWVAEHDAHFCLLPATC